MIATIYVRVSTDDQAEKGYSLDSQLKDCRKRAKELGATEIVEFIDDGYSGAFLDRPGLNNLREYFKNEKPAYFICYDPDRFARKLVHQLIVTEEIEKSGATIDFINSDYKDTPEGRMFYSIRGAFSEFEREKIKQRTTNGKKNKAEAGKIVLNARPYGYDWDKLNSNYIINEEETEMIRKIYAWYISGDESGKLLGAGAIADKLTLLEYPTKKNNGWNRVTVRKILTNEMYTGVAYAFKIRKEKIGPKKFKITERPNKDWIPIPIPAIIDNLTFEAAQLQAKVNSSLSKRNTKHEYLLRGLVECPVCGKKMSIRHSRNNTYFSCNTGKRGNNKGLNLSPQCGVRNIPVDDLENLFWVYMNKLKDEPELLNKMLVKKHDYTEEIKILIGKLNKKEAKLKDYKEKILKLFRQESITEEDAGNELKNTKNEILLILQERKKLESQLSNEKDNSESVIENFKDVSVLKDYREKRLFTLANIEKVIVKRVDTNFNQWGQTKIDMQIKLKV